MSFCANCPHFAYEHADMRRGEPCTPSYEDCDCVGYEPEAIG